MGGFGWGRTYGTKRRTSANGKEMKKKKTGFSRIVPIWINHCGPMSGETEGKSRRESNRRISHIKIDEANKIKELHRAIVEMPETEKKGM